MAEDISIQTEGVGPLLRTLNKVDRDLRRGLRGEIIAIAGMVAVEAKQIAEDKGLRKTGDLISHIRPGMRSGYAYVADTARHGGYNYPGRLEFEHGGEKGFLWPAAERKRPEAMLAFEALLDRVVSQNF